MKFDNHKIIKVENRDIINGSFIISTDTTIIEDHAFAYCTSLEKITIPNSVKYIGKHAFLLCNALRSIDIYSYETFDLLDEVMKIKTALSTLKNYYDNKIEYTKEDIEKFNEYVKDNKAEIKEYIFQQNIDPFFEQFMLKYPFCRKLDMDKDWIYIMLFKMDDFITQEEALELLEKIKDTEIRAMLLEYNKRFTLDPFEQFNLDDDMDDHKKYYKK